MKKLLFTAALLNSISLMASDNILPGLEDIRKGFMTSELTVDINSEAGEAYRMAARNNTNKDAEWALLRAVQLGHAYAPRVLFQQYGDEKPVYRELLLAAVLRKLETGFTPGLDEEVSQLGHSFLARHGYSLAALLNHTDSLVGDKASNKSLYYAYIIESSWRELGTHVVDLNQADKILKSAKTSLRQLSTRGDERARIRVGSLALKKRKLEEAKDCLLREETIKFASQGYVVDPTWEEAVKSYTVLANHQDKLTAYQALGEAYKSARRYKDAFEAFFEAFKLTPDSPDQTEKNNLFVKCSSIFQIKDHEIHGLKNEEGQVGFYRFLGYRFFSELVEQDSHHGPSESEELKAPEDKEMTAIGYLKDSIKEGYTAALETILNEGESIFPSNLQFAKFLEDLVDSEWTKEQRSALYYGGSREYRIFQAHSHIVDKIKSTLFSLYTNAQEDDFDLKYSVVKSLVKFYESNLSGLLKKDVERSQNDVTALFLRDHKETLSFMRTIDLTRIPKDDQLWAKHISELLDKLYKQGVDYQATTYPSSWSGVPDLNHSIQREKGYILPPESM